MIIANQSSWNLLKEKIKEAEYSVTDADLGFHPGEEDRLFEHLALKLHKGKAEIKAWIESLDSASSLAG